jgi:phosphoglycolate phosphatase-like HAD superfamily hydrolase
LSQVKPVVVLDFDGVLASLEIDWLSLRQEISAALNIEIDTFADYFGQNFGKSDFERVSELVKKAELSAAQNTEPYSDVRPALESLRTKGVDTFIASMQSIEVLNYFLKKHGLNPFFVEVFGREFEGSKRAQLEQIRRIQQKGKPLLAPSFVLIDDAKRNTVLASELGYTPILFDRCDGASLVDVINSILENK